MFTFVKTSNSMSDIITGIDQLPEPSKSIGNILIRFYETMRGLENDPERGGKQTTAICMAMSDIEAVVEKETKEAEKKRWAIHMEKWEKHNEYLLSIEKEKKV